MEGTGLSKSDLGGLHITAFLCKNSYFLCNNGCVGREIILNHFKAHKTLVEQKC